MVQFYKKLLLLFIFKVRGREMENSLRSDLLNCYYLSMYLYFLLKVTFGVVFITLGCLFGLKTSTQPGNPHSDQSLIGLIFKIEGEKCKIASYLYSSAHEDT